MERTRSIWTLAIISVALFMVTLDNLVVTNALVSIREDLGATLEELEWTVNAYTLSFAVLLLTGAALGDRLGRRRMFAVGVALFTVASAAAALAPTTEALIARTRTAGPRRRGRDAADPDASERGLQREPPRARARHLVGRIRPRRRARAGGRRRCRRGLLVAVDLLAERPDRHRAGAHGDRDAAREPRAEPDARRAGPRPRERRAAGRRARHRPRAGARLDEHVRAHLDRRRDRVPGGVRGVGAARPVADAADALLPQPRLRGDQRRLAGDVLRQLRGDLPARAVLPGGAGLLAARGGPAHAPVDGDADLRRADRGAAVRPDRAAAADGGRAWRSRRPASRGWRP